MARISNEAIAQQFEEIAELLDLQGANPFRVRAYRNAARMISRHGSSMIELVKKDEDLTELPGIGEDLAGKIAECVKTGTMTQLKQLRRKVPAFLVELLKIPRVGPKRANLLWRRLKIRSLAELRRAAKEGRLAKVKGLGGAFERAILGEAKEQQPLQARRIPLPEASTIADEVLARLRRVRGIGQVVCAGSLRRGRGTVGDIDILATAKNGPPVVGALTSFNDVVEVLAAGTTRATVFLKSGIQVDLRVVEPASFGSALQYFTGSKQHSIALRRIAQLKGLKLNEYGVFKARRRIAGETEESVYAALGLPMIEPELRENRGEIEAARKNSLPKLVGESDLKGDLHTYVDIDDKSSLEALAKAARSRGYDYIGATLSTSEIAKRFAIDEAGTIRTLKGLGQPVAGVRILRVAEVAIDENGNLALPARILAHFDAAVGMIRDRFDLPRARQTERFLRATEDRNLSALAHPIGAAACDIDMRAVLLAAARRGIWLEIHPQSARLDEADLDCRIAKDAGVWVSFSSYATRPSALPDVRFALQQGRRGWLTRLNVLNALPLSRLLAEIGRRGTLARAS
jgi:DNA polymerase (family 10)